MHAHDTHQYTAHRSTTQKLTCKTRASSGKPVRHYVHYCTFGSCTLPPKCIGCGHDPYPLLRVWTRSQPPDLREKTQTPDTLRKWFGASLAVRARPSRSPKAAPTVAVSQPAESPTLANSKTHSHGHPRWYSIGYKRSLRFFSKSTPTEHLPHLYIQNIMFLKITIYALY